MPDTLESILQRHRAGGAILFCGAGFTADCLNYQSEEELGVGVHLLQLINAHLKTIPGAEFRYKDLKNASAEFKDKCGSHRLMDFLKLRFAISSVTADMVDVVSYPWDKIYTTNFDNGIELALTAARKKPHPLNNLDEPSLATPKNSIVHLHGYAEKWDIHNFDKSCILDADQYLRLSGVSGWLDTLRSDIHKAGLVVFVGFSAADFHLNRAIYDVTINKNKVFFINKAAADPDPDNRATQSRFGTTMYVGKPGLAARVRSCLASDAPKEPRLSSFARYSAPVPSSGITKVSDIEDLFVLGDLKRELVARDELDHSSLYHVRRSAVDAVAAALTNGTRVAFISGEVCDGKSTLVEALSFRLSAARPIFHLRRAYEDMLSEVGDILRAYPEACLVVENCFDIRDEKLSSVAQMIAGTGAALVLTSRSISSEAEGERLESLAAFSDFKRMAMPALDNGEIDALINLTEQFAAWREIKASTHDEKRKFIQSTCGASLPTFLLSVVKSTLVQRRYKEEYNKVYFLSKAEHRAVVLALYLSNIGEGSPSYILSDCFQIDAGELADRLWRQPDGMKLIRRDGDIIRAIPAVGARNVLEHMVPDSDIVDSVVQMLMYLADHGRTNDFERFIFNQLMRYSILKSVVKDGDQINRFFDHISRVHYFRGVILFWLQWHIAKTDQEDFLDAEKFLENSYKEAEAYERKGNTYDRKQLDDRKSKFLMARALARSSPPDQLFRELKESADIVGRLLGRKFITHHPFETLVQIAKVYSQRRGELPEGLANLAKKQLASLADRAQQRLPEVSDGFQSRTATSSLQSVRAALGWTA